MQNYNLHIAISVRGLVNRKDFSFLKWSLDAHRQSPDFSRNLKTRLHLLNLCIWK